MIIGVIVVVILPAEGDLLLRQVLHRINGVGIIPVIDDALCGHGAELGEAVLQVFQGFENSMVLVILVMFSTTATSGASSKKVLENSQLSQTIFSL